VGGMISKGRALTVMTDSLWRLSYFYGYSTENFIRTAVRYLLGIPSRPVEINNGTIYFKHPELPGSRNVNILAKIHGNHKEEFTLRPGEQYKIKEREVAVFDVDIFVDNRKVENYRLIKYPEVSENEETFVPLGKNFLENISNAGNGKFIMAGKADILPAFDNINVKEPLTLVRKKTEKLPVYYERLVLLLFLYFGILGFYLKSRYCE
jgi:hypothetical protein